VSVEAELAESLNLQLGDLLTFDIGASSEARVTSLRGALGQLPAELLHDLPARHPAGLAATYLTSFYLAPGHDQEVVDCHGHSRR
jgi:putative ABC transport system permease protein